MSDPKTHYKLMNETDYLSTPFLMSKDVTLTIARVYQDELEKIDERTKKRVKVKKVIIEFNKTEKKLVANITNQGTIAGMYGVYTDDWIGKQITLYPTTCMAFGKQTDCIRVRDSIPQQKTQQAPPTSEIPDNEKARIEADEAAGDDDEPLY